MDQHVRFKSRDFPFILKSGQGPFEFGKKFGKKAHLDHQHWENLMQSKRTEPPLME